MNKNLLKLFNKKIIIRLFFVILFINLFYFNYITIIRLLYFILVFLIILLFKSMIKLFDYLNIIIGYKMLLFILLIDFIKLFYIHIIYLIYILMYNLKKSQIKYINLIIIFFIKHLLLNPLLIVLYKWFNMLYIWKKMSFIEIFFNRIFGIVIVILIFTPILSILFNIVGFKGIIIWYLILIFISLLYDITKYFFKYKIFQYVMQFLYISFNKDFHIMLAHRNEVSIFFILIKKSFLNFINIKNIIKWYVYSFYMIYGGLPVSISCLFDIKIISYNYLIKRNKIIQIHEAVIDSYKSIFRGYYINIASKGIDSSLMFLSNIFYLEVQNNSKLSVDDLYKLAKIREFILNLLKLVLYFSWDLCKLIKKDNFLIKDFFIDEEYDFNLKYDWIELLSYDLLEKINDIIKDQDFYKYNVFYEYLYIYTNIWDFFYENNNTYIHYSKNININNYWDNYIKIFLCNSMVLKHKELDYRISVYDYELLILEKLNIYKNNLIEDWKNESIYLNKANFYSKNIERLLVFNNYILNEVSDLN